METNDNQQSVINDIGQLIGFFECELTNQKKIECLQISDLKHVRKLLIECLSSLSGFNEDSIWDTLNELKV